MNATQIPQRVIDRVLAKVEHDPDRGCIISTYSVGSHGYAQVGWQTKGERRMTLCHRVAWTAAYGPIPDGLTVDHMCKQRRCIRVDHLRLLSNFENARRTAGRDWPLGQCAKGHPNGLLRRVGRKLVCAACHVDWQVRYRADRARSA